MKNQHIIIETLKEIIITIIIEIKTLDQIAIRKIWRQSIYKNKEDDLYNYFMVYIVLIIHNAT